jgi:tetratricopeptide (TPR) repeat protein/transcriptional regulator with XRE-family HTH domain
MGEQQAERGFGGLLRRLRVEAGLTQEELAAAASLSPRSVSDLERGINHTARGQTARLLAEALHLTGPARVAFEAAARGRASVGGPATVTRTLPRDIVSFTGRQRELARLAGAAAGAGAVVGVQAIGGMAGVGKTAFAVHAAHQLAPRFPDGQLFLPLHGHTPGHRPVEAADALASLLLTAGVAAGQIPPGLEARMGLWRDHVAGKQLLLVLDDAVGSDQVEPLLPGSAGSLVLVTSRRHLTALEDATLISLDVLPHEEAVALLVRLAARPGLEHGDGAVADICGLCGYLPLAVGMLARQLHHHPAWTPAGLAADLAAARDRLELMQTENVSVAAAFDLSYGDLTGDQRRLFRRLGLHPGGDIDCYAAAALDDTSLAAARHLLEALYDQYLLTEPAVSRYRLHDLIREHAHALAIRDDSATDRDQALGRLLDYYTHTATVAETLLARQTRTGPPPALASPPTTVPSLPDRIRALAWLRAERANLLACLDHVTDMGQQGQVVALTAALAALLRHDGPWTDAITRHTAAVRAARQSGDRFGQASALSQLGALGRVAGDYPGAARAQEEALVIYRELDDRHGQANALQNLGAVRARTGDYPGAAQAQEEALSAYRELGDRLGQANALHCLGMVRRTTGDYPGATQIQQEALDIYRELGSRLGQANGLHNLGILRTLTGNYRGAAQVQEEALGIYRELGERGGEVEALNELGTRHRLCGELGSAEDRHRQALELAREIGSSWDEAHALAGLGRCALAVGRTADAAASLRQAQEIFQRIGAAEAAALTAELDALTEGGPPPSPS